MKKLSYDEFQKRISEVNRASLIFKPLTNNISEAFELYQQVLAEDEAEKMAVFVTTKEFGNRSVSPIDDLERPKCPECGTELYLRVGMVLDSNGEAWNSAWVCDNCKAEYYSKKTLREWIEELKHV
jgi:uncharacterized protein with PIN domain